MDKTSATRPSAASSKRFFVVDNGFLVSMIIEGERLDEGATIVGVAASADHALQLLEACVSIASNRAALLDLNLNGGEIASAAARLAALGVPTLFVTGHGRRTDATRSAAPALQRRRIQRPA
jgi:hypothetical protein